jgi:hypothetical protein
LQHCSSKETDESVHEFPFDPFPTTKVVGCDLGEVESVRGLSFDALPTTKVVGCDLCEVELASVINAVAHRDSFERAATVMVEVFDGEEKLNRKRPFACLALLAVKKNLTAKDAERRKGFDVAKVSSSA